MFKNLVNVLAFFFKLLYNIVIKITINYTEVIYMINTAIKIFNRVYQSYLTGGDTYTYYFKTDDDQEIQEIIDSIKELENMGLVDLMHYNNKKARMCITSDGISYGNDNF